MIRSVWILLSLLTVSVFAKASVDNHALPPAIAIKDYGVYRMIARRGRYFSPVDTAGYRSVVETALSRSTTDVELVKNQVFGFNYVITDDTASGPWVPVTIEFTHPETLNFYGQPSRGFILQSAAKLHPDGRYHNSAFYVLTEAYEMVAGDWVIKVVYRGQAVATKTFTLSQPNDSVLASGVPASGL